MEKQSLSSILDGKETDYRNIFSYFFSSIIFFLIRFYDEKGEQSNISSFPVEGKYQLPDKQGSFELLADRVTNLGVNMYVV